MSLEIKVPEIGESITEVTIASWLKNDGETVEMDEVLCELESDKATFELPAEAAGKLIIKAQEGDTLAIGDLVCEIETDGAQSSPDEKHEPATTAKSQATEVESSPKKTGEVVEMKVPQVGESITEVTISAWVKAEGDFVKLDEIIAEIDSDKATFELPAEGTGVLRIIAKEDATLAIGDTICKIEVMEDGRPPAAPAAEEVQPSVALEKGAGNYASGHPSPAASKILDERSISPKDVKGTGVDGRITKDDAVKAQPSTSKITKPASTGEDEEERAVAFSRNERREKMSNLRKTVARRLVAVKNETAMLTTFNEVNMKPIMDLRKKYKESFKERYGVGLGFMSFFTRACCVALKEWPAVNGIIDGDELVYHDFVDVSIAVSAPKGLVVPVIRNAESLSFHEIESEVVRLATKARENKLSIPEMTGGTFTITNGGVFGSMLSTPIINAPQSAILGMHNIVERPVVEAGEIVIRPVMFLALSYDHRIIDGRESVSFLVRLKQLLEDPARLMLEI